MDEASQASGTVGARLRAAREARGQSIEEIGRQTRVPVRHLAQIEADSLVGLPAAPYSAGFVKAYARAVGLDPGQLSQQFRAEFDHAQHGVTRPAYEPYEPADPSRLPPRMLAIVALVVAILLVGGYAVWRSGVLTGDGPGARAELAARTDDTSPALAAPRSTRPLPPPAQVATGAVVLTARDPVWVSITERGTGAKVFLGVIEKGRSYTVPSSAVDPVIRLGKAESLDVTVGGRPVAPLGPPAKTVSNVSLKPDALLGRGSADVPPRQSEAPPPSTEAVTSPAAGTSGVPPAFRGASGH